METVKNFAENVQSILSVGCYSTTRTYKDKSIKHKGILTISTISNNDGVIVGIKKYHVGQDKHEETLNYHLLDTGVTSTHSSNNTYASHTSKITKATSKMFTLVGHGFSHEMNEAVKFKKIVKKNEKTGDITSKIYIQDKDNKYKFYSKIISKLINDKP